MNLATIRVLARTGWRVAVPRSQRCCGALQAHNGRLETARRLARRNARAFEGVDHVVANAAGCGAHMQTTTSWPGAGLPVRDVMAFLFDEGMGEVTFRVRRGRRGLPRCVPRAAGPGHPRAAAGAAASGSRACGSSRSPEGDRCCGAAGLYNVTEPELAGRLQRDKAEAVAVDGRAGDREREPRVHDAAPRRVSRRWGSRPASCTRSAARRCDVVSDAWGRVGPSRPARRRREPP